MPNKSLEDAYTKSSKLNHKTVSKRLIMPDVKASVCYNWHFLAASCPIFFWPAFDRCHWNSSGHIECCLFLIYSLKQIRSERLVNENIKLTWHKAANFEALFTKKFFDKCRLFSKTWYSLDTQFALLSRNVDQDGTLKWYRILKCFDENLIGMQWRAHLSEAFHSQTINRWLWIRSLCEGKYCVDRSGMLSFF